MKAKKTDKALRNTEVLFVRVSKEVKAAIAVYQDTMEVRPSETGAVRSLLTEALKRKGVL